MTLEKTSHSVGEDLGKLEPGPGRWEHRPAQLPLESRAAAPRTIYQRVRTTRRFQLYVVRNQKPGKQAGEGPAGPTAEESNETWCHRREAARVGQEESEILARGATGVILEDAAAVVTPARRGRRTRPIRTPRSPDTPGDRAGAGAGDSVFHGDIVSVWEEEKVLETDAVLMVAQPGRS